MGSVRSEEGNLLAYSDITPSAQVMQAFDELARPHYERIVECARESRTLTTLRDSLLPKLISGELRMKDAETFIGRAV